jgi:hypothetical protein
MKTQKKNPEKVFLLDWLIKLISGSPPLGATSPTIGNHGHQRTP